MAFRVQSFPGETLGQNPVCTMPHFTSNYSTWLNPHEQQLSQTSSKNLSLRVESSPQHGEEVGHSVHQLRDKGYTSTQSSSQSLHELTAMGKANSEVQCPSSESVQNQSYQKHVDVLEEQTKATFSSPIPYAFADPCFSSLLNAYGHQAIIQPQMVGLAPARIPLPPDVAQDSPMYVNAKQYHAILRRRQMRAKLEAQNKLVKNRKPYLHESRHIHALNRTRGSGGRFLSTKKRQQSGGSTPACSFLSASVVQDVEVQRWEANKHDPSAATDNAFIGHTNGDLIFQQPNNRISSASSEMSVSVPGKGGFVFYGSKHRSPGLR